MPKILVYTHRVNGSVSMLYFNVFWENLDFPKNNTLEKANSPFAPIMALDRPSLSTLKASIGAELFVLLTWLVNVEIVNGNLLDNSSVVSSAPTILRPWVRIPSTPSMPFSGKIFEIETLLLLEWEKDKNKRKRGRECPLFYNHTIKYFMKAIHRPNTLISIAQISIALQRFYYFITLLNNTWQRLSQLGLRS